MKEISGFIDHIIYRNADNGYTVFALILDTSVGDEEIDEEGEVVCTGSFSSISEGESLKMMGEFTDHINYGRQFAVNSSEIIIPQDEESIKRYLGSGAIKGIGPALAARIVKKFKRDTFCVMEEEPERLSEIKGISEKKAMEIAEQMLEKKDLRDATVYLTKYGISTALSVRIYNEYGNHLYQILEENPYRLAEDISGVGFHIADEIAVKMGLLPDSDYRICCGILYVLQLAANQGHTYLPAHFVYQDAQKLLSVEEASVKMNMENLVVERKIVVKEERIYLSSYARMEQNVAARLLGLNVSRDDSVSRIKTQIAVMEEQEAITLDEYQKKAIMEAVMHGFFVLTGGPGTGKTTTLRAMIRFFEADGEIVYLAAPTGRAAKRMTETTGYEARTIHRLLEVNGGAGDEHQDTEYRMFERNENNPLECDVVIIDEASMVDIHLMQSLLKAVSEDTRLIMVGDIHQLPSVGPGNVLRDIIESEVFPVVCLEKIFRQAQESDIVVNAHAINEGRKIVLDNKSKDFFFMERADADHILATMISLTQNNLPKYLGESSFNIQVLSPMRKGQVGVERLNLILQQALNPKEPSKAEYVSGDKVLREGDKVMQIKNNYQLEWKIIGKYQITVDSGLGVFNGDIGVIRSVNEYASTIEVEFDEGKMVTYPYRQAEELELAYAVTIHKSQGSEYPAVVIPLLPGPELLMNRNLIYTAITRAKKIVVLLGDKNVFYQMIDNTKQQTRYSGLKDEIIRRNYHSVKM